jgi:hypothetical protein
MAAPPRKTIADPAADAARLLRRLGFALLAFAPVAALVSRRGLVMVAPLGSALLILAAALESEGDEPGRSIVRILLTFSAMIAGFMVLWAGMSLIWTPFPGDAMPRLFNVVALGVLALVTIAALPARMRASNLNLFPIGLGAGGLLALVLITFYGLDPALETDPALLERVPLLFGLLLPPCFAWLLSRGRSSAGFVLAVIVTAALTSARAYCVVAGLAIGAGIYGLAVYRPTLARLVATVSTAGLIVAAPVIPFVLRPIAKLIFDAGHPNSEAVRVWARSVSDDPLRLLVGHGFDTAMRAKIAGLIPAAAPRGLLFETWFELGILGALPLAFLLWQAIRSASRYTAAIAPGALMTITTGFTLAVLGQVSLQSWWLTMLALAAALLVGVERGQYSTVRPRRVASSAPSPLSDSTPRQ